MVVRKGRGRRAVVGIKVLACEGRRTTKPKRWASPPSTRAADTEAYGGTLTITSLLIMGKRQALSRSPADNTYILTS